MENQVSRRHFLNKFSACTVLPLVPAIFFEELALEINNVSVNSKTFTILFQGDSITDGNRGRNDDPNHIMGHGYAFSIASRLGADYPDRNLKFINKGISGNTIIDLLNRWQTDTLDVNPDVVSILVGINDLMKFVDHDEPGPEHFKNSYRDLLKRTREKLPNSMLILGEPFILPAGRLKENFGAWTRVAQRYQQVVKELSFDFNTVWTPYQQVFNDACAKAPAEYWIWDGIHPTVAGHELMTRAWLNVVQQKLPIIRPEYPIQR
jgi:lysophospholipase L1-like esterase